MTEELNEELKLVVQELKKSNKEKRLLDVAKYINDKFKNVICTLEEPEDLFQYSNLNFSDDDIDNLLYIANQKYSLGDPYFLYELSLVENVDPQDFIGGIIAHIKDSKVSIDRYDFKLSDVTLNEDYSEVTLKVDFDEYKAIRTRQGIERTVRERYGYFNFHFLFQQGILLINNTDESLAKAAQKYLTHHYYRQVRVMPFKINSKSFKYDGPLDSSRTTVFVLELITNELKDTHYSISDYKKIGFENLKGQRVKTIRLGGSDLLNSVEVAEQVKNGFDLKQIELGLVYMTSPRSAITVDVTIQLQSTLKIVLRNIDNVNYTFLIVLNIYNKIKNLIQKGITLGVAENILNHYFKDVVSRQKAQERLLLMQVRDKLLENPELYQYKSYIDTTLREVVGK